MPEDIKPAVLDEGATSARRGNPNQKPASTATFDRFNPGAVPPSREDSAVEANVEAPSDAGNSRTATSSPSVEAEPGDDPQAPNRKGKG